MNFRVRPTPCLSTKLVDIREVGEAASISTEAGNPPNDPSSVKSDLGGKSREAKRGTVRWVCNLAAVRSLFCDKTHCHFKSAGFLYCWTHGHSVVTSIVENVQVAHTTG